MALETTIKTKTIISNTEFELISKIGRDIISTLEIREVIQRIYCNLNKLMDASVFAIGIYNEHKNNMDIWGINQNGSVDLLNANLALKPDFWLTQCFLQQKNILVNDFATKNYNYTFPANVFNDALNVRQSFIYVPLSINKKRLGMLTVQSHHANAYSEKHLGIIKNLSTFVAAAIQNAFSFQKIKEQNIELISNAEKIKRSRNSLEEVVRKRTFEVQEKNRKLENINKELEMLSIVARETENAVMIMDAVGNVLWINDYFTKIYKYTLDEFIKVRGGNILKTSFNPEIEKAVRKCISEKEAVVYEALNVAIDGSEVWTQTTLTPVLDDAGEITNLVTIDTDISKRKKAEKEIIKQKERIEEQAHILKEANIQLERLSIVAKETENAIMIMDARGNILWINEYFTKIYEYTLEKFNSMRGKNIIETSFNPEIKHALNRCIKNKEAVSYEALNVTVSGKEIWTQTTLTPVLDDSGEIKNLVTIDTNITKRKKAEAKVRKQHRNITDSIKYASRIQKAVMPNNQMLKEMFGDCFVFNMPRNIVSGDFYWARKLDVDGRALKILAVADCTGHGVPGAFVSMLGITLLTDIVANCSKQNNCISPAKVLEELRRKIKETLNPKGHVGETKDGMDMALCIVDESSKKLYYAGANNPLYHLKTGADEIIVYKPTKSPVGLYYREKSFISKEVEYNNGDKIFLFSDGIIDQFGGEEGRKFMAKNFKKILIESRCKNMCEQHLAIKKSIEQWVDGYDQVDDMLVVGVKL